MFALLPDYFYWHYCYGVKDIRILSGNILWFLWNFFSIGLLLRTFFLPWHKLEERGTKGDLKSYFVAFIITTLMRVVGMIIRLGLIIFGLIVVLFAWIFSIIASVLWLAMPLVVLVVFVSGVFLILFKL